MKLYSVLLFSLIAVLPVSERTRIGPDEPNSETAPVYAHALFAGGCFWGVEAAFGNVNGVIATSVGYTGGRSVNPTYRAVSSQTTGHAEAVLVTYDPMKVSYAELLDVFWGCHDPSADPGQSHRSVIFFFDHDQEMTARDSMAECEQRGFFAHPMRTQIAPATRFNLAEDYHQHYFRKMGTEGRCETGRRSVHTQLAADAARSRRTGAPGR